MVELISLEDHNRKAWANIDMTHNGPQRNGIECPQCKQELYDTDLLTVLTSYPPKKEIHCDNCGYKGYRIA